jgi:mannose-6-phosphate isomerase-like protein (cupin superfamily)
MHPAISVFDPSAEFLTPERCYISELFNRTDAPAVSLALARVEPGVTTQLHALHDTHEHYFIVEGSARIEVGTNTPSLVKRFDVVAISPGTPQRITNIGKTDLLFLCVCSPRFEPSVYKDLES